MMQDAWPPHQRLTFHHLEQLTDRLLDGVILMDTAGTILRANAAALRMHGVDRVEDLGATVDGYAERFDLRSEAGRPLKRRDYPLSRLLAGHGFPDLVVQVAPAGEGETRWVHQVRDVVMDEDGGEPDYLALVLSDVSERFDAEARFDAMFRSNPAPALVVRQRDQRIARANPGFLALTGFTSGQLTGRTPFGLGLFEGMPEADGLRRLIEDGAVVPQTEAELLVADGTRRLVLFAGQPIDVTDEDALLLTFADLEPRRQARSALAASERHLAALFELAPIAIAVTGEVAGEVVRVNAAFRELTGRGPAAIGRTVDGLALWADAEKRRDAEHRLSTTGSLRDLDVQLAGSSGQTIDCLAAAERIDLRGEPCTVWMFQDVTKRRRGELELVQAIDAVLSDAGWLSRSIMDRLATIRRPGATPAVGLSPREREILELICEGVGDAAISERLGLSRNTVRNHVARLYGKIGVKRRSAAVVWGRDRGLGGTTA